MSPGVVLTLLPLLGACALLTLGIAQVGINLTAMGIAREKGREWFALLIFFLPVVGWFYVAWHGQSVRWTLKFLAVGLVSAAATAYLFHHYFKAG